MTDTPASIQSHGTTITCENNPWRLHWYIFMSMKLLLKFPRMFSGEGLLLELFYQHSSRHDSLCDVVLLLYKIGPWVQPVPHFWIRKIKIGTTQGPISRVCRATRVPCCCCCCCGCCGVRTAAAFNFSHGKAPDTALYCCYTPVHSKLRVDDYRYS